MSNEQAASSAREWLDDPRVAADVGPRTASYKAAWLRLYEAAGADWAKATRRASWSWPAFLFAPGWLLYRKFWRQAVGIALATTVGVASTGITFLVLVWGALAIALGLYANATMLRRTRKRLADADAAGLSPAELAKRGGVSRAAVLVGLPLILCGAAAGLMASNGSASGFSPGPRDGASVLDCSDKDGVANALGKGELLELTEAQEVLYDETYKTKYCTAHAVTRNGSGQISYRLHEAEDGDIITEVRDGADGFHVKEAQILEVSPQKLDDISDEKLAAAVQMAQVARELKAAGAAEAAKTPERRAYETFHQECDGRAFWVRSHIFSPAERATKLRNLLQGYAGAQPEWLDDGDRECASEFKAAAEFLEAGGEYNLSGPARPVTDSVAPGPYDFYGGQVTTPETDRDATAAADGQ